MFFFLLRQLFKLCAAARLEIGSQTEMEILLAGIFMHDNTQWRWWVPGEKEKEKEEVVKEEGGSAIHTASLMVVLVFFLLLPLSSSVAPLAPGAATCSWALFSPWPEPTAGFSSDALIG